MSPGIVCGENRRRDGVKAFKKQALEKIRISVFKAPTRAQLQFTNLHQCTTEGAGNRLYPPRRTQSHHYNTLLLFWASKKEKAGMTIEIKLLPLVRYKGFLLIVDMSLRSTGVHAG